MKKNKQVLIAAMATVIMTLVMRFQGSPMLEAGHSIIALEFAKTPENAQIIMNAWRQNVVEIAKINTWIDFLYILAYASFGYFASLALTANDKNNKIRKYGKMMAISMLIAGFCDIIENICLFQTLSGNFNPFYTQTAFWFAAIKFSLIGIVFISAIILYVKKYIKEKK